MENTNDIAHRLAELEIKASFADDALEQLDQVIIRQQAQIDALMREVARLAQPSRDGGSAEPRNLRDELPPHY